MRPEGKAIELERRRRIAVQRVREGYATGEVARFLGVDPSSVWRWVTASRKHGPGGLVARSVPGRPAKLSRTQEKIVLRWLTHNPIEHGFATELWTCKRLAQLIEEEFGVRFHPAYLSVWLRARNRTPQKPHTGVQPTDAQMQEVLASLIALRISGDRLNGVETAGLDNVVLSSTPIPAPGALLLVLSGLACLPVVKRRSR